MAECTPILEVRNLKKYFPVAAGIVHAVDDVSFTIDKGKTLGVVGESGCGKSTLGRTLLHLQESTAGQVIFEGRDITRVNRKELTELRKKMQIIFQDPFSSLNRRMSLYQAIAEPLRIMTDTSEKEIERRVYEIMDIVGLADRYVNTYPHELDGGRRQRIGIARALIINPTFVVCDEPVSALDVSIQAQILNLMRDIQEERDLTYIFVTHDLSVVKYISDDIMVMYLARWWKKPERRNCSSTVCTPTPRRCFPPCLCPILTTRRNTSSSKAKSPRPSTPSPDAALPPGVLTPPKGASGRIPCRTRCVPVILSPVTGRGSSTACDGLKSA